VPERQVSRLVQLGSRGGDSRIREKEKNDDRRLSVLPRSGRAPCCRIRARGFALGSEPWRGTVDASLLLIAEIDRGRVRRGR